MKSPMLLLIVVYMFCGKKKISSTIIDKPPLQFELTLKSSDEIIIQLESQTTSDTLLISDPSYYPITFLRVFDQNGAEFPASKFKLRLNLRTATIQILPNEKRTFVLNKKLNVLFPNFEIKKISKIIAYYNCYAYENRNILLVDTLKLP